MQNGTLVTISLSARQSFRHPVLEPDQAVKICFDIALLDRALWLIFGGPIDRRVRFCRTKSQEENDACPFRPTASREIV